MHIHPGLSAQAGLVVGPGPGAIAQGLAKSDPGNAGWQRDLFVSHIKIGDVLRAQGNLPAALDAYIFGSAPTWQLTGTRWITGGIVVDPSPTGPITEQWGAGATPVPAATETSPGVYTTTDGLLVYGPPASE